MKIIYAFIIALILSVLAFFLAIRITDSTGAALFLLGMLPVTFFIIFYIYKTIGYFSCKKVCICSLIYFYSLLCNGFYDHFQFRFRW